MSFFGGGAPEPPKPDPLFAGGFFKIHAVHTAALKPFYNEMTFSIFIQHFRAQSLLFLVVFSVAFCRHVSFLSYFLLVWMCDSLLSVENLSEDVSENFPSH